MFTLRTAAAAGGWAAARLAVWTRRAERRVGARACSVRGGGAAGGGNRLRASRPQPPAQRAFPRRRLAEPPAHPGSSRAGERKPPNFLVSGAGVPGAGTRAGRGGRDRAGRPRDPPARGVGRGARAPAGWGFRSCRGAAAAAGGGTLAPGTGSGARGRHGAAVAKKLCGHGGGGGGNRSLVSGPEELERSPASRRCSLAASVIYPSRIG
nr:alanine and glycine-rich protein-like [Equus caballus]